MFSEGFIGPCTGRPILRLYSTSLSPKHSHAHASGLHARAFAKLYHTTLGGKDCFVKITVSSIGETIAASGAPALPLDDARRHPRAVRAGVVGDLLTDHVPPLPPSMECRDCPTASCIVLFATSYRAWSQPQYTASTLKGKQIRQLRPTPLMITFQVSLQASPPCHRVDSPDIGPKLSMSAAFLVRYFSFHNLQSLGRCFLSADALKRKRGFHKKIKTQPVAI